MFSNKRRDREIGQLQFEVERLGKLVWELNRNNAKLLDYLGLQESYVKEQTILVKKERDK